jgi:polar amino acid transport system substrate-binding protein
MKNPLALTFALLPFLLLGCSTGNPPGGFDGSGPVRIGYSNEAPFAYYDNQTGELTGESVEVTRRVLEKMGVTQVEGVITEFASLIPGLKAGRFDLIAAGMWILPPRCREILFSEPLSCILQGMLVREGNPLNLHSYRDVTRHESARLGVVAGGVELMFARAAGIPESRLFIFPDQPSAVAGLQAGRVDANAGPAPAHRDLLLKPSTSGLEAIRSFAQPQASGLPARTCSGIGFRKGDKQHLDEFNRHLTAFIGTPEHLELIRSFGFTEAELPTGMTTEELCTGAP